MNLVMYTDNTLNELKSNAEDNLKKYGEPGKFVKTYISNYDVNLYSLGYDVEFPVLNAAIATKSSEKKQWEIDCENAILLHKTLVLTHKVPLSILSDERFISYLTHDMYNDYMKTRWPIGNDDFGRLKEKYFLPSGSQAFTRNTFMRYFWYTHITYDENNKNDPYELTKIAFEYADPVNQIMERKYGRNSKVVKAALIAIKETPNSKELNPKRTMYGKAINNIIGIRCLDALKVDDLVTLFKKEIMKIVKTDIEDTEVIEEE